MQTKNGNYINSLNIEVIIKKDDKYYAMLDLGNEELIEISNVIQDVFGYIVFVPGTKLNETIDTTDADKSIVINKELKYFEKEKDVSYFINVNKIVRFEKFKDSFCIISTNDHYYYFEILAENLHRFENKLPY